MNRELTPLDPTIAVLHAVRLEAVVSLYRAKSQEERQALYDQAAALSALLNLPMPMLPAGKGGPISATRMAFWAVVEAGLAASTLQNHLGDGERIAINLPEVREAAVKQGRPLLLGSALTRALSECPRLIAANHAVSSRVRTKGGKGVAVRCWVFSK